MYIKFHIVKFLFYFLYYIKQKILMYMKVHNKYICFSAVTCFHFALAFTACFGISWKDLRFSVSVHLFVCNTNTHTHTHCRYLFSQEGGGQMPAEMCLGKHFSLTCLFLRKHKCILDTRFKYIGQLGNVSASTPLSYFIVFHLIHSLGPCSFPMRIGHSHTHTP